MYFSQKIRSKFSWIVATLFFFGVVLSLGVARDGETIMDQNLAGRLECSDPGWSNSNYFTNDNTGCPDVIEVIIRPTFINEKNSELVSRIISLPSGLYGTANANSGYTTSSFNLDVDGINLSRQSNFQGVVTQGITNRSKMTTKNNLFFYPFDKYSGDMSFQAVDGLNKSTVPIVFTAYSDKIQGWNLSLDEGKIRGEKVENKTVFASGVSKVDWKLSRSGIVYFSVLILVALMLIALFSVFFLTRSVLAGKRPPSMNLLLWISTILFAILQVRISFPGNPPIGILLDYVVVFPVLSSLLFLGIVNILSWIRRADWDLENEPKIA